jgi:hypothetical protein
MTYQNDTMNDGYSGNLRAASAAPKPVSGLAAGPFDLSSAEREK